MKWLKRISLALLIVLLTGVGAATYLAYKYQDKAVPFIVAELNNYLITPIQVGEIKLSFIERFPQASIKFQDVTAFGSNPARQNDTLFHVGEVYLTFSLIQFYNGVYDLNYVEAHDGKVNLHTDAKGTVNFEFLKQTDEVTSTSEFQINLEEIILDNVDVRFQDDRFEEDIHILADRFTAKGRFSNSEHQVALYGSGLIHRIKISDLTYLKEEPVFLDAGMEMNPDKGFYRISRGKMELRNAYTLDVEGEFHNREIELKASAKGLDVEVLPALLPADIAEPITDLKGKGKLAATISIIRDEFSPYPTVHSDFELQDGSIHLAALQEPLTHVYAKAHYTNGKKQSLSTSSLSIDSLALSVGASNLNGKFQLRNFEQLHFVTQLHADVDHASLKNILQLDTLETFSGKSQAEIKLKGQIRSTDSITINDVLSWDKNINLTLQNTEIGFNDKTYLLKSGHLEVDNDHIALENVQAVYDGANIRLEGLSRNGFKELLLGELPTHFYGNLTADSYTLRDDENAEEPIHLNPDANYDIHIQLGKLEYAKVTATNLETHLKYYHGLDLQDIRFESLGGVVSGSYNYKPRGSEIYSDLSLSARQIDIQQLFENFNNFGQNAIRSEHLSGKADIISHFTFTQNEAGKIDSKSIAGEADLTIENGELIDYKPLYSLVDDFRKNKILRLFIKLDDFEKKLHHIQFETLHNTFRIENETVFIPQMKIKSSALDLELSGQQTFENDLDYRMSFNLKQILLAKQSEPVPTEYGYIEDDGTGNKMVYLHITGNVDNPKIRFDKWATKIRRKEVVDQEVKTTKSVLNQELGLFKNDTSLAPLPEEKKVEQTIDLDEFQNELETDKKTDSTTKTASDTIEQKTSKWKKMLKKASGEESKSKFENWEFENDDW